MDKIIITHKGCEEECVLKAEGHGCGDIDCCGPRTVVLTITCPKHGSIIDKEI